MLRTCVFFFHLPWFAEDVANCSVAAASEQEVEFHVPDTVARTHVPVLFQEVLALWERSSTHQITEPQLTAV